MQAGRWCTMSDFTFYFNLGWHHLLSAGALDHILFLLVLTAAYPLLEWKNLLVLVTAFTAGHSLTLALSVADWVHAGNRWVEFAIPLTIITAALFNFSRAGIRHARIPLRYLAAGLFGLIHGLGFAGTIRFMLAKGQGIGVPLAGFNLGLEVAQLLLVALIMAVGHSVVRVAIVSRRNWVWSVSAIALIWSTVLAIRHWPY